MHNIERELWGAPRQIEVTHRNNFGSGFLLLVLPSSAVAILIRAYPIEPTASRLCLHARFCGLVQSKNSRASPI